MENIGDQCVECGKSSARGSGRFVNRVPAETDNLSGFMCGVCVDQNTDAEAEDTAFNVQDFKRTDPAEDPRIAKLERQNKKLTQENNWLKESRPQETLEETITDRLGDEWIDYIDSKGLKRDPDGLCPAELETAFIGLVEGLHKFFKSNRIDGGFSRHSSRNRELMVSATPNDLETGAGVLEISPLQWELMIAITQYIEGHVIDSDDIIYVAEKR